MCTHTCACTGGLLGSVLPRLETGLATQGGPARVLVLARCWHTCSQDHRDRACGGRLGGPGCSVALKRAQWRLVRRCRCHGRCVHGPSPHTPKAPPRQGEAQGAGCVCVRMLLGSAFGTRCTSAVGGTGSAVCMMICRIMQTLHWVPILASESRRQGGNQSPLTHTRTHA